MSGMSLTSQKEVNSRLVKILLSYSFISLSLGLLLTVSILCDRYFLA